jgi:hypothetical protein
MTKATLMTDETAEPLPDNVLFEWYRRYLGEPDTRVDVYLGFGLFFGGIGLGMLALLVFLYTRTLAYQSGAYFAWTEPAYALGMVGLPVFLLGIIVLLPVERRAVLAGAAGVAITVAAVAAFAWAYPRHWNYRPPDYSGQIVLLYGIGLAGVFASTGAALFAYLIAQTKPRPADFEPAEQEETESYTDEEIRADIDQAMSEVDITWGGVEKHEGTPLQLNVDTEGMDVSGMAVEADRVTSTRSVDNQVADLKALKGGEKKTAKSTSTVDDQTARLTELRERKRNEEPAPGQQTGSLSDVWDRIKSIFRS